MRPMERVVLDVSEKELMHMTRDEVTMDLTPREIKFCEYFTGKYNVKIAAIKAGYAPSSASVVGWRIRKKENVNRYIAWLKVRLARELHLEAVDFLDLYARIAFADMTDFYDLDARGRVIPRNKDMIDGQIVSKIRQNREGTLIELEDRMKALDKLEKYFDVVPADWNQKIQERKVLIMEEKLALEKQKYDDEKEWEEEAGADPLVEAMGETTMEEIWEEDEEDWDEE